jgi:ribosome-associated protein
MKKLTFRLNGQEFIQLDQLLKLMNIASSGGEAHIMIENGEAALNGEAEYRKRKKLFSDDTVKIFDYQINIVK